ncbi:thermostable hemolysin [Craterilacuibacter sp.]|uniref:thermostable hemolysin n=1 Tax=Craterilacuibacter sp. TaxID=2870909 RepID=UPI003F3AED28
MSGLPQIASHSRSHLVQRGEAHYPALTRFISHTFRQHYQAQPDHFLPWLLSEELAGETQAVLGVALADRSALYLEHYLAQPIEQRLALELCRPVARSQLVEIGNLAAHGRHAATLIRMLVLSLHAAGRPWVVFTAPPRLTRMLAHMGLMTRPLLRADPACLPPEQQKLWGSYYAEQPWVTLGLIAPSFEQLSAHRAGHADWAGHLARAGAFARRLQEDGR